MDESKKIVLVSYKKLSNELVSALNKAFRVITFDTHLHFSKSIDEIGAFDLLYLHLNIEGFLKKNLTNLHWLNRQEMKSYSIIYVYKHIKNMDILDCQLKIRKLEFFSNKKEFFKVVSDRVQSEVKNDMKDEEISICSTPASPRKLSINVSDSLRTHETKLISLERICEIQEQYDRLQDSLLLDNEAIITVSMELEEQKSENAVLTEQYECVYKAACESKEILKNQEEIINSKEAEIKKLKEEFEKLQKSNEAIIQKVNPIVEKTKTPPKPKRRNIRVNTSKLNLIEVISDTEVYSYPYTEKQEKSRALAEALKKKAELISQE